MNSNKADRDRKSGKRAVVLRYEDVKKLEAIAISRGMEPEAYLEHLVSAVLNTPDQSNDESDPISSN